MTPLQALERLRAAIAADRCDGDTEYATGVNAACANHLELVDAALATLQGLSPAQATPRLLTKAERIAVTDKLLPGTEEWAEALQREVLRVNTVAAPAQATLTDAQFDELMEMVRKYGARKFFQGFAEAEQRHGDSERHGIDADCAMLPAIRAAIQAAPTHYDGVTTHPEFGALPRGEEPTDDQLRDSFVKDSGGPNPYYRCLRCGETEPGLREYLAAHWKRHAAAPTAPSGD